MGGMMGGNEPRQFGYMDGDRKVSALMDMLNGGGQGRAGQRFEGGGLLSDIGNAMFRPYGFEERLGQVRPQARPMRQTVPPARPAAPVLSPFERFGGQPPAPYSPPQLSPLEMFGGQQPAPYSPPQRSPLEMFGGQAPAPYSPNTMTLNQYTPEERAIIEYLRSIGVPGY